MHLHPSEVRARLEVLQTALKRLLTGSSEPSGPTRWTRRELFESPSAQSHQLNWQRHALRILMARGLVVRVGHVKKPLYTTEGTQEVVDQLAALVADPLALEALLRERFEYGSREDVPEDDGEVFPFPIDDDAEPTPDGQADSVEQLSEYEMLYVISKNVIYIREAVDDCRQRIERLEKRWLDSTELASTPEPAPSKANGTLP